MKSWTAISTRPAISVTGRITPVVAQSGPRPHRFPGQPHRWLVQAMARTPDHPAPAELLLVPAPAGPEAERPKPKPRKGTPRERVTKTHSMATVPPVSGRSVVLSLPVQNGEQATKSLMLPRGIRCRILAGDLPWARLTVTGSRRAHLWTPRSHPGPGRSAYLRQTDRGHVCSRTVEPLAERAEPHRAPRLMR